MIRRTIKHYLSIIIFVAVILLMIEINKNPEEYQGVVDEEVKQNLDNAGKTLVSEIKTRGKNLLIHFGLEEGEADESKIEIKIAEKVIDAKGKVDETILDIFGIEENNDNND